MKACSCDRCSPMNKAHLETEGCNSNVTLVGDASRVVYVNFSYRKRALRGVVVAVCWVVSGQCVNDYMDWFFRISHPFMTPGQASDPLPDGHAPQARVIPQASKTDIPHVLEPRAPSTSARLAVEEPRHAVVSNTNNLCHLHQYFHNNLCNLFVLYLTGSLSWDCWEVGAPSEPRSAWLVFMVLEE